MRKIQSSTNPNLKRWKSLLDGRGIRKNNQFLLSGHKLVPEFLKTHPERFVEILTDDGAKLQDLPLKRSISSYEVPKALFKELDIFGTNAPLLVGTAPELPLADFNRPPEGLEVVCALGNPLNLGTLLRSCEAFDVKKVILLSETASPYHPKTLRASSGSALKVKLERGPSLQELDTNLVALDYGGEDLSQFMWPQYVRLLVGEEGQGVPPHLKRKIKVSIKTKASLESLNAVAATSIALYSYRLKWPL